MKAKKTDKDVSLDAMMKRHGYALTSRNRVSRKCKRYVLKTYEKSYPNGLTVLVYASVDGIYDWLALDFVSDRKTNNIIRRLNKKYLIREVMQLTRMKPCKHKITMLRLRDHDSDCYCM